GGTREEDSLVSLTRRRFVQASTLTAAGLMGPAHRMVAAQTDSTPPPSYGGTMVATTAADIQDLDPAISYGWADYSMVPSVFEGLLGPKPQSTELMPLLAADMPTVSEDGSVYTVTLRRGVKFQPPVSREVTADDFKYSWLRVLNPETASPG